MICFCGYGGYVCYDSTLSIYLFYDYAFTLELTYCLIYLFICPSGPSLGIRSLRNRNIYHHIFAGCPWGTVWVRAGYRGLWRSSTLAGCKIIILFSLAHRLCSSLLISVGLSGRILHFTIFCQLWTFKL